MPYFGIEVTCIVESKAFVIVEADDEHAAYDPAQEQVNAGGITFEEVYKHIELGAVHRLNIMSAPPSDE
jgi:hypothetical protein